MVAGRDEQGFERLVIFAGPCYWGFTLLASLAVIILRQRDRQTPSGFRLPLYPLIPLTFAAICGWLVYAATAYIIDKGVAVEGVYTMIVLALGGVLAMWNRNFDSTQGRASDT
jgi:lysylphosphatidylglycerol synthetase-like protein (DUF2156 family)